MPTPTDLADAVASAIDCRPPETNFQFAFATDAPVSYELVKVLMTDKLTCQGGNNVNGFINYRDNGTAEFVNPGAVTNIAVTNVLVEWTAPWREIRAHFGVFDREIDVNQGPEKLIDLVEVRRKTTQFDMARTIEDDWFDAPDSTSSVRPNNLAYFCVPITSTQVSAGTDAGAFQGQLPTGFSAVQGIDPSDSTYVRWRNWNFNWSNNGAEATDTDVDNCIKMFDNMQFAVPPTMNDLEKPQFTNCKCYVPHALKLSFVRRAREQNDNVGYDIAAAAGQVTFMAYPIQWNKKLDTYSAYRGYYPFYLSNWRYAFPVVRTGRFFSRRTFPPTANQPDLVTTWMFLQYQNTITSRQLFAGVGSYVA